MYKRFTTFLFTIYLLSNFAFGQSITNTQSTSITLKPDATQGKDAMLFNLWPTTNRGNHPDLAGIAWTNGGRISNTRALIEFDLSRLPPQIIIDSAELHLFGYNSPSNIGHSTQSGPNSCVLRRVSQSWDEDSVTWNNQPNTIAKNEVILPTSTNANQHYKINVTALVRDMLVDSIGNYGFMLKLQTEQYYRSLLFASSDNVDSTLHPELKIHYSSIITNLSEIVKKQPLFHLFPNPVKSKLTISSDISRNNDVQLLNSKGVLIQSFHFNAANYTLSLEHLASGLYFMRLRNGDSVEIRKIIKQ